MHSGCANPARAMDMASALVANGERAANSKAYGRSKLTNHKDLLPDIGDGRRSEARRFRDLVRAYLADSGGVENCSEIRIGLLRRLAAATILSEALEARAIAGEPVNITEFCTLASTGVRLAMRLGIRRVAKDVSPPSLQAYLAQAYADDAEDEGLED